MPGSQPVSGAGQFEAILDSLDEGVLTLADDGTVIGINRAACEMLEVDKAEALHRGCTCMLGEETCSQSSLVRQAIAERRPINSLEVHVATHSGKAKVLNLRTNVLRGEAGGGIVIFRDVTELDRLRRDLEQRFRLHNIIGKSKRMQDVFELIEQVADVDASVLVEGETGTGKELVARAIHQLGPRATGPFVAVNCSALPESLLESELFGHVKGAFTGAMRDKIGRFQAAEGGTIFLDEIGDISQTIQVKLLRVLQERTIERVGDEKPIAVNIRVISATNRPLVELVSQGAFRQDLLYRLRVIPIQMPALRERRDDIPLLAHHFIERFREATGRPITDLDAAAQAILLDYHWPGNVRELENVVEYAFVKARSGLIMPNHLPPELTGERANAPAVSTNNGSTRGEIDRERIEETLTAAGWNVSKTARRLGMSRTTLYKRMREFGLTPPGE